MAAAPLGFAVSAVAAETPARTPQPSAAGALPSPLTSEAVRELVSRLSDQEVRKLLIDQLDKAAVKTPDKDTAKPDMGMLGMVEHRAGTAREGLAALGAAIAALPAATRSVIERLADPEGVGALGVVAVFVAIMLAGAALAEVALRRLTWRWREALRTRPGRGLLADTVRLLLRLALELAHVLVFGIVALALFFAFWQGHEARRILVLGLLGAVVLARVVGSVADFLLAPSRPQARLLPLDDATARTLARTLTIVAALFGVLVATRQVFAATGVDRSVLEAVSLFFGIVILAAALVAVWRVRVPVAELIRRAGGNGPIAGWVADLWPLAAALYLLSVFAGRVWESITGQPARGEGILSLAILVALPVADFALCRALAIFAAAPRPEGIPTLGRLVASYEQALRRLIHIVVVAVGVLALAKLWDLDLFGMAERSLGGQIASALLGIGLVLLIAYVVWEIVRTAIDRRLAAEIALPEGSPSSRLRTLLPLMRIFVAITLTVMTVLSVLAALGVNIVPLLAGASIVGVAIGFGSQTLVRDIVSGAFFLMDDAFRVGEYIEVGDAKGTVEKITVRALFLRHHRGALNILPYGQITRLRNTSRDWITMILEFRLALETDLRKVKKIVKTIGDEIAADAELGPALLTPVKSGGVIATDDSSITLRIKYTAKPGDGAFMVRRVAYEKILKAFKANGVEFASRRVAVYVPPGEERNAAQIAAAALPAIEAAAAKDGKAS